MKINSTKSKLISSLLVLTLCVTMFVGSTYAWFTDEVTSGNNIITSGNLDVTLDYYDAVAKTFKPVEATTAVFNNEALWEPGYTEVAYLKVGNAGNLALKYQIAVDVIKEVAGTGAEGEFNLSDHLVFKPVKITADQVGTFTRETAMTTAGNTMGLKEYTSEFTPLEKQGDTDYLALIVYMPTSVDNVANAQPGTTAPSIEMCVNLFATQLNSEEDSFNEDYDVDAPEMEVGSLDDLRTFIAEVEAGTISKNTPFVVTEPIEVTTPSTVLLSGEDPNVIDGAGITLYRADDYTGNVFEVKSGATLTLKNITVDGGAVWTGAIDPTLQRGTVNSGVTAGGALVVTEANAHIELGEGAILQNNAGANAVNLGTRTGGKLTLNGGEIINNYSAAGAIWGGGEIILNSGKINNNHGGIGGAIRAVTNIGTLLTMNGGEMNHNYSDGNGGAIWAGSSRSNNVYVLNGGEMAYNYSATTGGAIYAGYYETVKIGDTFKMHDNDCAADIGSAIRFHDHASLVMTGGEIYNQDDNGFFLNNNSASITGGKIAMNFGYSGGLGLTVGEADIDGVVSFNLGTNHNTAYLAAEFSAFKFTVNETAANFAQFNFKPAAGYTYTEGDEAKLICMNEGYETYWDAATGTFRLQAK